MKKSEILQELTKYNRYEVSKCCWNMVDDRRSYLQNRNRDTDIENKCMDTEGGKERFG